MSKAFWRSPLFVLISAVGIVLFAYGGRQSLGMFLRPVTEALGFMTTDARGMLVRDFEPLSFATAIQVLIYGCAAPFVGAIADRWGPIKVLLASGLIYSSGLFMMSQSTTEVGLVISIGFLMGLGSSGIALPMLLSIVGRVAPENRRTFWMAVVVTGGTAGQMLIVPLIVASMIVGVANVGDIRADDDLRLVQLQAQIGKQPAGNLERAGEDFERLPNPDLREDSGAREGGQGSQSTRSRRAGFGRKHDGHNRHGPERPGWQDRHRIDDPTVDQPAGADPLRGEDHDLPGGFERGGDHPQKREDEDAPYWRSIEIPAPPAAKRR